MAVTAIQKFLDQLSKNKNVKDVVDEFQRLSTEVKKRGQEMNAKLTEGGEQTWKQAHDRYNKVISTIHQTQKQLDREVENAVGKIRASATQLEKNLDSYRKQAHAQKDKLAKMIRKSAKSAAKTPKKSPKRAARKSSRKKSR